MVASLLHARRLRRPVSSHAISLARGRGTLNGGTAIASPSAFLLQRGPRPVPTTRLQSSPLLSPSTSPSCQFCSQSTDNEHHRKIPKQRNRRSQFTADWNATLAKHPQTVIITFLSTQSTTWLVLYASLSTINVVTLPPSLAAGWLVAKFTKKFRQPVNAALAALLVRAFPTLSEVKVTPLVTGFVMGDKDKEVIAKQIDEKAQMLTPMINAVSRGAKWLEGPIDKYGLSYYLSSRISGVATIGISSYLVNQGVDITAYLSTWGIGQGVGEAAGTAAAAAMCNIWFLPLHFYASVYGVRSLDGMIHGAAKQIVDGKLEAEREFRREYRKEEEKDDEDKRSEDDGYRESEYERISDGAMRPATLLLLVYSLMVSFYSFRLLGKTATSTLEEDDQGGNKGDADEQGEGMGKPTDKNVYALPD